MSDNSERIDRILVALERYNLKQVGVNQYRSNSPLRPASNSHAFAVTIDPPAPGGGVYFDHVSDEGGDFLDLEAIVCGTSAQPVTTQPPRAKKSYRDLADYAADHGPLDAFIAAGWKDATWSKQRIPAFEYPTPNGPRFRLIDGGDTKYIQPPGYQACLYGLEKALAIVVASGQPLTLCNGEASVVVAQYYGVAACCQNMGEKKLTAANLATLQTAYPAGEILIALDCDTKGRKAALDLAEQLRVAGYSVRASDLNGGEHFDLADFCRLHQYETPEALHALKDLPEPQPEASSLEVLRLRAEIERLRQTIAEQQREIEVLKAEQRVQNDLIQNKQVNAADKITILMVRRELAVKEPHVPSPDAPRAVNFTALAERAGQSADTISRGVKKFNGVLWERHVVKGRDEATGQPRTIIQLAPLPALNALQTIEPVEPRAHGGYHPKKLCADCGSDDLVEEQRIVCRSCGCQQGEPRHMLVNLPEEQVAAQGDAGEKMLDVAPAPQLAVLKNDIQSNPSVERSYFPVPQVAVQAFLPAVPITDNDDLFPSQAPANELADHRAALPPLVPWEELQRIQASTFEAQGRVKEAAYLRGLVERSS